MEKTATLDRESVIGELTQGMELANEVKRRLCPSLSSREACGFLVEKIVSCYDNALAILLDYMALIESSQRSEVSEQDIKHHICKTVSRIKRKSQPWSEQVDLCSDTGCEGQLDDGYYWRKYGQKDILGANHPRAYYRCTYRHTQGCLATKQVQRTDEDPSILKVFYRGKHSCIQERLKESKENPNVVLRKEERQQYLPQPMMISSEPACKVESENVGNFFGTSYSSPFLSPATPESYFSLSPISHSFLSSETGFPEMVSDHFSHTSFPLGDLDLLIDQVDLDSHFHDAIEFF